MAVGDTNPRRTVPILGAHVPNMGTMGDASRHGSALFGRARGLVLGLLVGRADERFHTAEIIEALSVGRGAVQLELNGLTDAGILLREREGRQVYYRANPDCPIYAELVSLVRKTVGLVDLCTGALAA